ncbi:Uncharacterized protein APZ42_001208 [Daphnia magna]|uniref:Uncharacterized protein n=1 Tax=Daphnia magna TaxID=35525 RepID=A0A162C827_9CRUS|nr:Uncharacterized protein APZ42_001208 [Daphnia magna]
MANNSAVRGSSRWTNKRKAIRLADKELENICQSVRFNVPLSLNVNSNEDSVQVNNQMDDCNVLVEGESLELSNTVEASTMMLGSITSFELEEDEENYFMHDDKANDYYNSHCDDVSTFNTVQVSCDNNYVHLSFIHIKFSESKLGAWT